MQRITGVTFNVHAADNRPPSLIADEVGHVIDTTDAGFLCLQETVGYWRALRRADLLADFKVIRTGLFRGGSEAVVMVRRDLHPSAALFREVGDGWITVRGGHAPARVITRVTLDGWLRVGNIHVVPGCSVDAHGVHGPPNRVDDYRAALRLVAKFFDRHTPRLIAGDWNIPASNNHPASPRHAAQSRGGQMTAPHGHAHSIDAVASKNVHLTDVRRLSIGSSDHDPVVFTVHKS